MPSLLHWVRLYLHGGLQHPCQDSVPQAGHRKLRPRRLPRYPQRAAAQLTLEPLERREVLSADPVTAYDDSFVIDEDEILYGNLLDPNPSFADTSDDGGSLWLFEADGQTTNVGLEFTLSSGALVQVESDGTFTYNPNHQFDHLNNAQSGTDTFTYSIGDKWGNTDTALVTIFIVGADEPLPIDLSRTVFSETTPAGGVVGTLTTNDPEVGSTYTLTDDADGTFFLEGDQLKTNQELDFETQSSYSITVQASHQSQGSLEQIFTLTIQDAPEPPSAINLSNSTISESDAPLSVVGSLTTIDPDGGDTHTYSLTDDAEGTFLVEGDQLKTTGSLDFETQQSYSITVRSTDQYGQSLDQVFTISILDVPETLTLSNATVAEDQEVGTVVGTLSGTNPQPGDTYTLLDSAQETFTISGNQLIINKRLDFETQPFYSIRVLRSAANGSAVEQTFTITVTDVNEPPRIENFAAVVYTPSIWIFTGRVIDEDPASTTVSFGGVLEELLDSPFTQAPNANGVFTLAVRIPNDLSGAVTATVTDSSGQQSDVVFSMLW